MNAGWLPAHPHMAAAWVHAAEPTFRPWRMTDFVFMFVMWAVMMVGMMTPSVTPMVLLYATAGRNAVAHGRPLAATGWFLAGYLAAWIAFSLCCNRRTMDTYSACAADPDDAERQRHLWRICPDRSWSLSVVASQGYLPEAVPVTARVPDEPRWLPV